MRLDELRARRKHRLLGRRGDRPGMRGTVMLIVGAAAMLAIFYMLGARCGGEASGRAVVPAGETAPDRGTTPADGATAAGLPPTRPVRAGPTASDVSAGDEPPAVVVVTVLPEKLLAGDATLVEWGEGASPDVAALTEQLSRLAARGATRVRMRAAPATAFRLITAVQAALRDAGLTVTGVERAD